MPAPVRTTSGAAAPEIQVTTAPITRGDIVDTVGATGTLQAVTTVQVGSQVSGNIQWLGADFNTIVKKGQVIARLDPSLFDAQLQQARANLAQARANLTKAQSDLDRDAGAADRRAAEVRAGEGAGGAAACCRKASSTRRRSRSTRRRPAWRRNRPRSRRRRPASTQSQASVNQNQVNLDHTVIVAPIDGIVTQRSVDVGQTVAASMQAPTLFVIAADLTEDAGQREHRRGRRRPHPAGPARHVPRRCVSDRQLRRHGLAGSPAAGRRAERHHLRHRDRRAEPAS